MHLLRSLGLRRSRAAARPVPWDQAVTVRLATEADASAIARLAGRDTRPVPAAPLLLATCGDEVVAALSLRDGAVVADPFRRTAEIVELLRCRAGEPKHGAKRQAAWRRPPARDLGLAGGSA